MILSRKDYIARAVSGNEVLYNQRLNHIYMSFIKAHDKNFDSRIISENQDVKVECVDDKLIITAPTTDIKGNTNILYSLFIGDSKEELNQEIIKELKKTSAEFKWAEF